MNNFNTDIENYEQVFKTTNYAQFKINKKNREISKVNIRGIKESILQRNLLHLRPILVNASMEVIDGQHRLEVARQLNLPIYFVISGQSVVDDMALLNGYQKNWTTEDFFHFSEDNEVVKVINCWSEKYKVPRYVLLHVFTTITKRKELAKQLLNNSFQFRHSISLIEAFLEFTYKGIEWTGATEKDKKRMRGKASIRSLWWLWTNENIDHKRLLRTIADFPVELMYFPAGLPSLKRYITVYNKNLSKNKIKVPDKF